MIAETKARSAWGGRVEKRQGNDWGRRGTLRNEIIGKLTHSKEYPNLVFTKSVDSNFRAF